MRLDDSTIEIRAVVAIPPICTAALINKPTALPYRIRVPFFTVLYWPRPASSAPALFILVYFYFEPEHISTLAGAPFQAMKANYLIGVFVCLLKIEGSR